MNQQQYRQFLDNPVALLNGPGNVRQIRLDGTMTQAIPNTVSRTVHNPGAVPLHYQYSAARVTPVTLRYDDTTRRLEVLRDGQPLVEVGLDDAGRRGRPQVYEVRERPGRPCGARARR